MIDCRARVDSEASLARLQSEMKAAGVSRAVLSVDRVGTGIEELREIKGRHRSMFQMIGRINPTSIRAIAESEALRVEIGVAGIELCPDVRPGDRWVNLPHVMSLWERLESLAVPVNICIASQDYNQFSDVVTAFPRLRVVLDDLGRGPESEMYQYVPVMMEYARYPQVHICLSDLFRVSAEGHPHRDLWPVIEEIVNRFGSGRVVWGSGYPEVLDACGYRAEAEFVQTLPFLSSADTESICEVNAARLWFEGSLQTPSEG